MGWDMVGLRNARYRRAKDDVDPHVDSCLFECTLCCTENIRVCSSWDAWDHRITLYVPHNTPHMLVHRDYSPKRLVDV